MSHDHTIHTQSQDGSPPSPWVQLRDIIIVVFFLGWLIWLVNPIVPTTDRSVTLGQVQGVRFFGTFGVDTQVDIRDDRGHERSLLVVGVSQLHKGQDVVLHVRTFGSELCSADGVICETLRGHPQ